MRHQDWLFPHAFRTAGWLTVILLLLALLVLRTDSWQEFVESFNSQGAYTDAVTNVLIIGFAIGLILIAFSREKQEDEMIQRLRLQALQWSVYVNYFILILCSLLFYWGDFFNVLVLNMYTVLFVFIAIFRWTLFQMNRRALS